MTGLSRFDFYPRDWFLDTRNLSNAAKGIYVDIFSAMYNRGGPLPYDEQELCGLCGCKTVRSLRPLLQELIEKEKVHVIDGFLVNNRTMEEIAAANRRIESGRKGGKARSGGVQGEYTPNTAGTHAETDGSSVENQGLNPKLPSPSPSPSSSSTKKGAGAPAGGKEKERGNGTDQDPVKALFDLGVSLLTGAGVRERQARSLVGRWRGKVGDEALASILMTANRASEPVAYIEKAIQNKLHPSCETFI